VIPCNSRAGKTVEQGTGYLAFIPADVPPTPPVAFDTAMIQLLSAADLALGRLSGIAALLPNPDLFVAMYVKKEAVLSSQIEGIDCTLDEVIAQEESDAGVFKLRSFTLNPDGQVKFPHPWPPQIPPGRTPGL